MKTKDKCYKCGELLNTSSIIGNIMEEHYAQGFRSCRYCWDEMWAEIGAKFKRRPINEVELDKVFKLILEDPDLLYSL